MPDASCSLPKPRIEKSKFGFDIHVYNPSGRRRVLSTKPLVGTRWLRALTQAACRVEVCQVEAIMKRETIKALIGDTCHAVIGQITERACEAHDASQRRSPSLTIPRQRWDDEMFACLSRAGGRSFCNYGVGYDNVDVAAATRHGVAAGNTPGVQSDTVAELTVGLTLAAARRFREAERTVLAPSFDGPLPSMLNGKQLRGGTLGLVGAGKIGAAYARMMARGMGMSVLYHGSRPNEELERQLRTTDAYLRSVGEPGIAVRRCEELAELLESADVVTLCCAYSPERRHLIDRAALARMKPDAVLVNIARGALVDEAALVERLQDFPDFRAGLDVFEHEPKLHPGLRTCLNAVILPHIGAASVWTRSAMAAGWLGIKDAEALLKEAADEEPETLRPPGMGLGATFISHNLGSIMSTKAGQRLETKVKSTLARSRKSDMEAATGVAEAEEEGSRASAFASRPRAGSMLNKDSLFAKVDRKKKRKR
ncbi:D-isomer specific 2-hydroxyacid dehydrogenase [Helicosporidium sp. ATCC 50920]|nr:D-isomer specific 2-hydroxyacid dehydrogenase [Helicosporidium sp. ATCC 50920]|eukprot:KDD75854.1 D-isomer specific 2-hydroxyacid dehydrogenase [Helicosporidium sp. ATCC 50920]